MTPTFLIPRDLPLEQGRKLVFTFTVAFEVTLDEDLLGDSNPADLIEVEKCLGDPRDPANIYRALAADQSRNVVEYTVSLDDRYEGADDGDVRFETTWEAKERERGQQGTWPSRAWLDHVPSAGALPLGPESNPPVARQPEVMAPSDGLCKPATAEEVMTRDG